MALARGFKAQARQLANEIRVDELCCDMWGPFDPWALATDYGIRVLGISEVGAAAESIRHLTEVDQTLFSGALLPLGTGRLILENDSHELVRRRSTVAHEMSHVLLEHVFSTILVREKESCRNSDQDQELEAAELSGELLVPSSAAISLARRKVPDEVVAEKFAVSLEMARWRMHVSGARTIAKRTAAARRA